MKTEVQLPAFLPMTFDGGERVASYTAAILPGARREGPRGRLLCRIENLFNPPAGIYPWVLDCPFRHQDTILTELSWLHSGGWLPHITDHYSHLSNFLLVIHFTNIMFGTVCWFTDILFYGFLQSVLENGGIIFQTRLKSLFQTFLPIFIRIIFSDRSRWPCGLRNMSTAARLLVWRFRILLREWIFVCCVFVVCCVGSNLCV